MRNAASDATGSGSGSAVVKKRPRAAQARAYYESRDYVIPDDVQWAAPHVLPHRILPTSKTRYGGGTTKQIVSDIIGRVKVPV